MESIATLTAGMAVKPNVSPQPTTPLSVVTETISESTVCSPALPQTAAPDGPPVTKGIRNEMDSILAIFMVKFSSCPRVMTGDPYFSCRKSEFAQQATDRPLKHRVAASDRSTFMPASSRDEFLGHATVLS
jgi:hypothetical protein